MKFIRVFTIVFILLFISDSSAQFYPGARQIAISHSDAALANDIFSLFNNPAGLSQMDWSETGIYYSPAPFGMKELANGYAAYHMPMSFGSLAAGYMTYGYELYKENKFALGYSRRLLDNFFTGITLIYQNVSIQNYGNDHTFSFILGGLIYLNSSLRFGFSIDNLFRATYGSEENQIPVVYNAGTVYDFQNGFVLMLAIQKEIDLEQSFRLGIEYQIIKYLDLRIGAMNNPNSFSAGLGINYSVFHLDYALVSHPDLGLTHQAGLIISFGRTGSRNEMIINNFLGK